jgi:hypothetical protein
MNWTTFAAASAAAIGMMSHTSLAQSTCAIESVRERQVLITHGWSLTMDLGGWIVTACPTFAQSHAIGFYTQQYDVTCVSTCVGTPWSRSDIQTDPDAAAADLVVQGVSASSSIFDGGSPPPPPGATANISFSSPTSGSYLATQRFRDYMSTITDCTCWGKYSETVFAFGWAAIERNYVFERVGPGDMSYDRDHTYMLELTIVDINNDVCTYAPPPPPPPGSAPDLVYVESVLHVVNMEKDDTTTDTDVIQGAIAIYSDGTVVRLGLFQDND